MPHAIGSATISFGLVSIPVKLHSATQSSEHISFNLLHGSCGSRLKQQYVCAADGERVERADMVKGYEFAKGQYVVLSDDELKAMQPKPTESIDIAEFVPMSAVDPLLFDKPYYLSPQKGADRAYRLLAEAMKATERWAIARYAARGREYIVCLRPVEGAVVMQQLHYAAEVRPISELDLTDVQIDPRELKMAIQVAEFASSEVFDPSSYQDDSKQKLRELIRRKIEGEEITVAPGEAPRPQVVDLMEALRASLADVSYRKSASTARLPVTGRERKPARRAPRTKLAEVPKAVTRSGRGGKASR